MTTVFSVAAASALTQSDQAAHQYLGAAVQDLQSAADALQSGQQQPSWVGTRLLAAGNELMEGIIDLGGSDATRAAAIDQVRDGVRALGRPMCISGQLPQTSVADLVAQLQSWTATIQSSLAAA